MPVVVGRDGVRVDLQRQRGDGLVEPLVPESVAERGEQQGRGLPRDPRHRHHDPGDDAGAGRRDDDAQADLPLRESQPEAGLPQGARHQAHHLLAGPQHDRDQERASQQDRVDDK